MFGTLTTNVLMYSMTFKYACHYLIVHELCNEPLSILAFFSFIDDYIFDILCEEMKHFQKSEASGLEVKQQMR